MESTAPVLREPGIPAMSEPVSAEASGASNLGLEALKDISFGSIAGASGKVIEYPFDTVKVRLQSQPDTLPLKYKGPLDCFRQSFREAGIGGLYRGVSAPLFGAAAETACLFFSYRLAQDFLRTTGLVGGKDLSLTALTAAAAMSGGATSLILTPIELVKCRIQVPLQSTTDPRLGPRTGSASASSSPLSVIADVYRRDGLLGFWRGQLGTFFRETGGTAAWFGMYEASSMYFRKRLQLQRQLSHPTGKNGSDGGVDKRSIELPTYLQMSAGALAGMSYNFIFFPADTIKSKIQTGELTHVRPTFWSVGKVLWRVHGLKGLYRGCGITVARSAPSSALIFTVMEKLKAAFA